MNSPDFWVTRWYNFFAFPYPLLTESLMTISNVSTLRRFKEFFSIEENRFIIPLLIFFLALVILPEWITWAMEPEDLVFNGVFINITDFNVYLSAIRQGSEGRWLFQNQFTPDQFPVYFAFFPYIIMGKLLAVFGGTPFFWYQFLRVASFLLVIFSFIYFLKTIFPNNLQLQKTSFTMLLFSSGIGWLMLIWFKELTLFTPDLSVPEWSLITISYSPPHFLLEIAIESFYFASLIKYFNIKESTQLPNIFLAGIAISLTYPYRIPVIGLVLAIFLIGLTVDNKKIPWKFTIKLGAVSIPMLIALYYYGFYLPQNPNYNQYISNNEIIPPPLVGTMIGLGFLLPLVIFGLGRWWKNKKNMRIIVIWLISNLIAIYLPLKFSGRLIIGLFIPVVILAAYGLEIAVIPFLKKKWKFSNRMARSTILILTMPSTLLFVVFSFLVSNTYQIFPYFNRVEDVAAAQWLAETSTDEDLILASFPVNNLLPRYANGHVFHGHFDLTINIEDRFETMEVFWDPQIPDRWRQDFIDEWGFTYIYQGYYENALSGDVPLEFPYEVIYSTDEVIIYKLP